MFIRTRSGLLSALAIFSVCVATQAAPIQYTFTTGTTTTVFGSGVGLFAPGTFVSGSFTYNPDAPYLTTGFNGASSIYQSISNFSATVGGHSFSDGVGYSGVANDFYYTTTSLETIEPRFNDLLELYAGPTGGPWTPFTVGSVQLSRARLFWLEGLFATPDFLSSESLPAVLPSFAGRLALDFGPLTDLFPPGIVWFDGLSVTAVPEPATLAVFGLGLMGMGIVRRRSKSSLA